MKLSEFIPAKEFAAMQAELAEGKKRTTISDILSEPQLATLEPRQAVYPDVSININAYVPISCADLMANPPAPPIWVVDSLFPQGTVSIIGGDGGVGKSWLVLYLALCVASGQALFGKFKVKQGKVLLIDEEDALPLIHQRMSKLMNGMELRNPNDIPLLILDNKGLQLQDHDSYERLSILILKEKPTLVTLDSLIRVHNADENSANEMNDVLRRAKALIANFDSAMVFTHHTRKPSKDSYTAGQMLRGSGDIRNFVDSYLYMRGNGIEKTLIHDKSRWAPPVPEFKIKLEDAASGNATVFSFAGDKPAKTTKPVAPTKIEQAKELVMSLLTDKGKMSRKQIVAELKKTTGIGENSISNALAALAEDDKIKSDGGDGTTKEYWLSTE